MPKIIIGTANFGNVYGVSNHGSVLSVEESGSLIRWAQNNGLNHFDTAISYGNSTEILRTYLDFSLEPTLDTKLNDNSCQTKESIVEAAEENRDRLGTNQLSVLYLHNENLLQTSLASEISIGLKEVLNRGIAKKIGVSVYSQASIVACKETLPELSVFQVPENICDRRLIKSEVMQELAENGNIFNIRSIFLQGLLLMDPITIPPKLNSAKAKVQELVTFAEKNSVTVLELCLAYAKSISWASGIVVGAASLKQLMEIDRHSYVMPRGWSNSISTLPTKILDPREWSL
jgi:aryl-alcohol dehydrogenase-like predicted oxidoreductase